MLTFIFETLYKRLEKRRRRGKIIDASVFLLVAIISISYAFNLCMNSVESSMTLNKIVPFMFMGIVSLMFAMIGFSSIFHAKK